MTMFSLELHLGRGSDLTRIKATIVEAEETPNASPTTLVVLMDSATMTIRHPILPETIFGTAITNKIEAEPHLTSVSNAMIACMAMLLHQVIRIILRSAMITKVGSMLNLIMVFLAVTVNRTRAPCTVVKWTISPIGMTAPVFMVRKQEMRISLCSEAITKVKAETNRTIAFIVTKACPTETMCMPATWGTFPITTTARMTVRIPIRITARM